MYLKHQPKRNPFYQVNLSHCTKKRSFPLRISKANVTKTADLIAFTEEMLNGKLDFLCSELFGFNQRFRNLRHDITDITKQH